MTSCHVFIATSLDGFIARQNGDIDWLESLPAGGEDHGYDAFMESIDGLIMGRGTYEKVLSFDDWPYRKPAVVLSRTLQHSAVPARIAEKVRISAHAPEEIVEVVSREGWKRAYIDGGQLIQSFLRAGLVEDLVITRIPVLLGSGLPLFGPMPRDQRFRHVETTAFPSGLVQSKYRISSDQNSTKRL
jgi:dihydrofolate reductase